MNSVSGTWETVFDDSISGVPAGKETITLRPDGTFTQRFNKYPTLSGTWSLHPGSVLRLSGAKDYTAGVEAANRIAEGGSVRHVLGCLGQPLVLKGADLLLCAGTSHEPPLRFVIFHLPVGDPDAPKYIEFQRSTP